MTNKEAAHIVDVAFGVPQAVRRAGEDRTYHEEEIREAKKMAINALQQTCEDAISRQAVLDNIDAKLWEYCTYLSKYNGGIGQRHASALANIIREAISELPSVQIAKDRALDKAR